MAIKPNTICKNRNCTKGSDGGRKHYYVCQLCTKKQSWKSIACSIECYEEYMKQVAEARAENKPVDTYPERSDMTREEVITLVDHTPIDQAVEMAKEELKDYIQSDREIDFSEIVERVNQELDISYDVE